HFYGAITMTDSLESHFGYIQNMKASGEGHKLQERYQFFLDKNFIDDNVLFAKALFLLFEKPDKENLEKSLDFLLKMKEASSKPLWHLAQGYIRLRLLMESVEGLNFSQDLYNEAHRSLTLALDLAQDEDRIKASALTNLGLLHLKSHDYGLSAKYFEERMKLGFIDQKSESELRYLYSKTLFQLSQYAEAQKVLESFPIEQLKHSNLNLIRPYLDKVALNALYSGDFQKAKNLYSELLKLEPDSTNSTKFLLNLGYAEMKLNHEPESKNYFLKLINRIDENKDEFKKLSKIINTKISFSADRLKLISLGFLAQLSSSTDEKLKYLNLKRALLNDLKKNLTASYITSTSWQEHQLKSNLQILDIISLQSSRVDIQPYLNELFETMSQLSEDKSQHLSYSLYQSLTGLSFLIKKRNLQVTQTEKLQLKEMIQNILNSYQLVDLKEELLLQRGLKLKIDAESLLI
nr:hypothetical protein [Pseudobdellovibrionaceae bacterium]